MANGCIQYAVPNYEERRPGITAIIEELQQQNPGWSYDTTVAFAKEEWHKRNPSGPEVSYG